MANSHAYTSEARPGWRALFRVLLKEPSLLSSYASGYAALLREDAAGWGSRQAHRLIALVALGVALFLFTVFAGVALMLYGATGEGHWLLWVVPLIPLLTAAFAGWDLVRSPRPTQPFPRVRAQVEQDMALFGMKEPQQ